MKDSNIKGASITSTTSTASPTLPTSPTATTGATTSATSDETSAAASGTPAAHGVKPSASRTASGSSNTANRNSMCNNLIVIDKNLDFADQVIPGNKGRKYSKHISPSVSSIGRPHFVTATSLTSSEAGAEAADPVPEVAEETNESSQPQPTEDRAKARPGSISRSLASARKLMSVDEIGHANSEQYLHKKHLMSHNADTAEMVFTTSIAKTKLVKSEEDILGRGTDEVDHGPGGGERQHPKHGSKRFKRMRSWMTALKRDKGGRRLSAAKDIKEIKEALVAEADNKEIEAAAIAVKNNNSSTTPSKKKSLFSKVAKVTKVTKVIRAFKSSKNQDRVQHGGQPPRGHETSNGKHNHTHQHHQHQDQNQEHPFHHRECALHSHHVINQAHHDLHDVEDVHDLELELDLAAFEAYEAAAAAVATDAKEETKQLVFSSLAPTLSKCNLQSFSKSDTCIVAPNKMKIIVTSAEDADLTASIVAASNLDDNPGAAAVASTMTTERRSSSAHNLTSAAAALLASASRKTSNSSAASAAGVTSIGGPGGGATGGLSTSALSSKRNSCTCRKCSLFDDCDPKEASTVIKYLRFRKVGWTRNFHENLISPPAQSLV